MHSELGSSIGRFGLIAAGGYAFGPIGAAVGALLGGFLFSSSGPDIEGPRLGDLDVSSSTYGGVIPLGFGVQKVAGTIIWATDIEEEKRTRTEGEGIFGWGGQDVTEYFYYGNFAVLLRGGPGGGRAAPVGRVKADLRPARSRRGHARGLECAPRRPFHRQLEVQVQDPPRHRGPGAGRSDRPQDAGGDREADAVPAHRGLVYIVVDRLPLAEWNNRIPPITAEIAWSGARPATVRNASFLPHAGGTTSSAPAWPSILPAGTSTSRATAVCTASAPPNAGGPARQRGPDWRGDQPEARGFRKATSTAPARPPSASSLAAITRHSRPPAIRTTRP
jgi:hypothetical protein